jgi:hypothetical protein
VTNRNGKEVTKYREGLLMAARRLIFKHLSTFCPDVPLGELAQFVNGTSYTGEFVGDGDTPIIRISNISDPSAVYLRTSQQFAERFMVSEGDLLVSWSASFKSIIWPGPDGVLNQHIFKVTPLGSNDRRYLRHAIEDAFSEMRRNQVGIGMMHLRRGDFLGHNVPHPTIPVQTAVGEYLDWIEGSCRGPEVPLPDEIRAIESKLRSLRRLIAGAGEVDELWSSIVRDGPLLLRSMLASSTGTEVVMSDLVQRRPLDVDVQADETYHFAGVYSFGRGVFVGEEKPGLDFSYKQLTRLRAGDFVYPKLMAWEGALGVVPPECDGLVVSPEFPVFEIDQTKVLPEVLDVAFRDPAMWPRLRGSSTGTNVRRRRLNPKDFLQLIFELPEMQSQLIFQKVKRRVDELIAEVEAAAPVLDALLPSIIDAHLDDTATFPILERAS